MNGNIKDLLIGDVVFESSGGTNKIYESVYCGESCYSIEHTPTGHMELIDHDKKFLGKIISKIRRSGALTKNKDNDNIEYLKFKAYRNMCSISLCKYAFMHYNGISTRKRANFKVALKDNSLLEHNIVDLRKCNLYEVGGFRPEKGSTKIQVVDSPHNNEDKYIIAEVHSDRKDRIEMLEYSRELETMLSSSKFCSLSLSDGGRISVRVSGKHNKRRESKTVKLSRFIEIYEDKFDGYKNKKDPISRFIRDFPRLNKVEGKNKDVAHVNAHSWNNHHNNLMWMDHDTNNKMGKKIQNFVGDYSAFPITISNKEILVEICLSGTPTYFRCTSPEAYLELQNTLLGFGMILGNWKKLPYFEDYEGDCRCISTPKEEYARVGKTQPADDVISAFWDWCEHKDKLLTLYEENQDIFKIWQIGNGFCNILENDVLRGILIPAYPTAG